MKTIELTEGDTTLLVPADRSISSKDEVFYNEAMSFSRDLSIYIAKILKPARYCDLLAGTGARGIRIAKEAGIKEVTLNDRSAKAVELIKRNLEINGMQCEVSNKDANILLAGEKFDYIDVDPFGPPVAFIDSAIRALNNRGILSVTATDTSALCGSYPRAARRKYDSTSLRTDYYDELGLRILVGYVLRSGLKYNISFKPLFSHCTRHYMRVYLRAVKSSSESNKTLENIQYIQHCFKCLDRRYAILDEFRGKCSCGGRYQSSGPLWSGKYADESFSSKLIDVIDSGAAMLKMVDLIRWEQEITNPYYDMHKIFHKLRMPPHTTSDLFKLLEKNNFKVVRTHFSELGMKTDAKIDEINNIL